MKYIIKLFVVLCLISCSSPKVAFDYDETVNFNKYKTYNIYPFQDSTLSDIDQKRITTTLNDSLKAYGLTKKLIPDFNVNVYSESYQSVSANYVGVGVGTFGGGLGGTIPINSVKNRFAITIEFIDGLTKSLFWQGVVETSEAKFNNPEKRTQLINEMIGAALKKYPGFYPELVED